VICPVDGDSRFLRNVCRYLLDVATSRIGRLGMPWLGAAADVCPYARVAVNGESNEETT
jgi:hypothetical protein